MEGIGWWAGEQTWRSATQTALFDHDRPAGSPVLLFATDDDSGRGRRASQPPRAARGLFVWLARWYGWEVLRPGCV